MARLRLLDSSTGKKITIFRYSLFSLFILCMVRMLHRVLILASITPDTVICADRCLFSPLDREHSQSRAISSAYVPLSFHSKFSVSSMGFLMPFLLPHFLSPLVSMH